MHSVLANQVARSRGEDGSVNLEHLLEQIDRAYVQFDRQRQRNERENALMLGEIEIAQARQVESLERLRQEHDKLEIALESMPHALAMYDGSSQLVISNSLFRLGARLSEEHVVMSYEEVLANAKAKGVILTEDFDQIPKLMAAGQVIERIVSLPTGHIVSTSFRPRREGGWVEVHCDVTEQQRANAEIKYLATHDSLTGLANRTVLRETIDTELSTLGEAEWIGVLCIDLDHFKAVNDTLGHPVGDKLLQHVASRLRDAAVGAKVIARLGGDEFAVLFAGSLTADELKRLARRIVVIVGAPYLVDGNPLNIGASIGIAIAPIDGRTSEDLMRNADIALYRAKHGGRGGFRFFETGMDEAMLSRRRFDIDLRAALGRGEFEVYYQPLVDLKARRVHVFEALLRWRRNGGDMVPPDTFIPVAEELGLIEEIGAWVLRQACRQAMLWPADISVAVNVSPLQLVSSRLIDDVQRALRESGLGAERLELEVTESVLIQNTEHTVKILHTLRDLGVRIAMDDFGTGYSSLSYLRRFPFHKLKIDRSFINDIAQTEEATAIVRAIIQLANTLGMTTTAEGVENNDQKDLLRALNCSEAQGFLISRPVPAEGVEALLPYQVSESTPRAKAG